MATQFRRKTIYACLVLTTLLLLLIVIGAGGVSALGSSTDNYMPGWYMISNQNKDGIALRDAPSTSGNLIKRFPYGTRFYVDAVSGHWGSTVIDGYSGWTHLGYSDYLGDSVLGDSAASDASTAENQYASGAKDYLTGARGYYTISTTYKPGIALHPSPDHSSAILVRVPNGTDLYISEIIDNYGYTTYEGFSGWINLDYAVLSGYQQDTWSSPEPVSISGNGGATTASEGFYVFPNSSTQALMLADLEEKSLQQLNYGRNEIYARHGRRFKSAELMEYFTSQSWYHGTIAPENFQESMLNEIEKSNIDFLYSWEYNNYHPDGYVLDQPGYDITRVYPANSYSQGSSQVSGDVWMAYRDVLYSGLREFQTSYGTENLTIREFAVKDLDQNGIPELLLTDENHMFVLICGFDGQNVVDITYDHCWQGGLPGYSPDIHTLIFHRSMTVGTDSRAYVQIAGNSCQKRVFTERRLGDPQYPDYYIDDVQVIQEDYYGSSALYAQYSYEAIPFYSNSYANMENIKSLAG